MLGATAAWVMKATRSRPNCILSMVTNSFIVRKKGDGQARLEQFSGPERAGRLHQAPRSGAEANRMATNRRKFLQGAAAPLSTMAFASDANAEPAPPKISHAKQNPSTHPYSAPSLPPVTEHSFSQYQLTGAPDKYANLLGIDRPQNWNTTKLRLQVELKNHASHDDPIHEWLSIFRDTFADRASKIVINGGARTHRKSNPQQLRYEPQLYEGSLRGASILLDRCLKYRNELGNFEMGGVNAALSYLAFLKLKPLQRNFLIQSNSADISHIAQSTEEYVSEKYNEQITLFNKDELLAQAAEAAGSAASAARTAHKTDLLTSILEKQFHIQTDFQLASFTRMLTPGNSSNFAERYLRTLVMLSEDLADAYCRLYSASRGLKQVIGLNKLTISGTTPIDIVVPLFSSANAVDGWVEGVVGAQPLSQRKPDILDALVLWS